MKCQYPGCHREAMKTYRFCKTCKSYILRDMRAAGYLEPDVPFTRQRGRGLNNAPEVLRWPTEVYVELGSPPERLRLPGPWTTLPSGAHRRRRTASE